MRRVRRRRPAGHSQVPIPVAPAEIREPLREPALVRIGPDHTVLDAPWGLRGYTIAQVWRDAAGAGGWARVVWPVDARSGRQLAPLDLHLGHVLELSAWRGAWDQRYGWVADVDERRMVLVPAASAADAVLTAGRAVDLWRAAELSAVEDAWRARFAAAQQWGSWP